MGENIYLGDRNCVRTPMQWSADRNAGFSRANPQSLYLPVNLDPENHYEAVNVDVQQRNPSSLLWWTKRLIALHKRWKAFSLGTLEFLHPENPRILAWVRRWGNESILVVANLSRFVQPATLDLSAYQSLVPIELFGREEFPPIGDEPYFLTLGPHAFYWFSLESKIPATAEMTSLHARADAWLELSVTGKWDELLRDDNQAALERALRNYLPSRPWFGCKGKFIKSIRVHESISVPLENENACFVLLHVDYVQSEPELCLLPMAYAEGSQAEEVCRLYPSLVIARLKRTRANAEGLLYDAIADPAFCLQTLGLISRRQTLRGAQSQLE